MAVIAGFIIFYIAAVLVGTWSDVILPKTGTGASRAFRPAFGGCLVILIGMTVCTFCAVFHASAAVCIPAVCAALILTALTGLIAKKRGGYGLRHEPIRPKAGDIAAAAVTLVIILLQVFVAVRFRYGGAEPLRNIGIATAVYESAHAYPSDPMMVLTGCLAAVLKMHPLRLIYEVLPLPLITLYYLCYISLIDEVFDDRRSRMTAFLFLCVLNIRGYQSELLVPATLLLSWFGIWVYVIHGLLNIAAVLLMKYLQSTAGTVKEDKTETDDLSEEWDMNKHRIVNARNLAVALAVLAVALVGVVLFLNHKINRLYDATVNLQADINSKCSVFEFAPDGGQTEGYLVRGSDGSLSFIGGGSAENADELELFISKYGTGIRNWYVYGDDEDNAGAAMELTGSGRIAADRIFVIDRKEITKLR